jgi:hypothetical protein
MSARKCLVSAGRAFWNLDVRFALVYHGRMDFRQLMAWLMFWKRGETDAKDMPPSIILLTRSPRIFTQAELEAAGERGWGEKFDGKQDPMFFAFLSDALTVLKAGKYVVHLVQTPHPYSDDLQASAKNLPREEQKKAWYEHNAWSSFDLWNGWADSSKPLSKKEAYAVLARFALQLGDANCCAIYFPKEGWMLPNNGEAEEELRRLIGAFPLKSMPKNLKREDTRS